MSGIFGLEVILGWALTVGGLSLLLKRTGIPYESNIFHQCKHFTSISDLQKEWYKLLQHNFTLISKRLSLKKGSSLEAFAKARALESSLHQVPLLKHVLLHVNNDALKIAQNLLEKASKAYQSKNLDSFQNYSVKAKNILEKAIGESYSLLVKTQRKLVTESISQSLQDMGYKVDHYHDDRGEALFAVKGSQGIGVVVEELVHIDTIGFSGISCTNEITILTELLKKKGFLIKQKHLRIHGKKEGGQLIQKAQRIAHEKHLSPAKALLEAHFDIPESYSKESNQRLWALVWGKQMNFTGR